MEIQNPIIKLINDSKEGLDALDSYLKTNEKEFDLIKNYPTVYIHNWKNNDKYEVYVGESNSFFNRTIEHLSEINNNKSWQKNIPEKNAQLYVIAHPEFNKSLTLDIENKLIHYLTGSPNIFKVHNSKGNPQNKYFTRDDFDKIFSKIWRSLRKQNNDLFLSESIIKDTAIYKASPLHKLTSEQQSAKDQILGKVIECFAKDEDHQLIFVQGEAGTGKTVLMSSLFYDFFESSRVDVNQDGTKYENLDCAIVVNHKEQKAVYKEIVEKLDLVKDGDKLVYLPTTLINLFKNQKHSPKKRSKPFDVIFVDEAHLLLTQNNQSFTDNDQLDALLNCAKVVVAMFDENQVLSYEQYKGQSNLYDHIAYAKKNNSYIVLDNQLRMKCNKNVTKWINSILYDGKVEKLHRNRGDYDIRVFDDPYKLEKEIKLRAKDETTKLSRIVATYDWPYILNKPCDSDKYWNVTIGSWKKPWNGELDRFFSRNERHNILKLCWAEQPQTINEVGSTFTIQGFDLNYVGVIIGPSVKYRDGKIIYDSSCSCNKKAIYRRTLKDGKTKKDLSQILLRNELGILLKRGVNGLYIYACDEELRKQLKKSV